MRRDEVRGASRLGIRASCSATSLMSEGFVRCRLEDLSVVIVGD